MDRMYLEHQSSHCQQSFTVRLQFMGFLITINLALFAAIYYLQKEASYIGLSLLGFLVILNLAIYFIYIREHILDIIIKDVFRNRAVNKYASQGIIKIRERIIQCDPPMFRKLTWRVTSMLLCLFVALPISMLIEEFWRNIPTGKMQGFWIWEIGLTLLFYFIYEAINRQIKNQMAKIFKGI